ncbi:hypothetical protein AGABI1DRAFT_72781 [Agaricus bisporus var. burnettii JB137-S8]|uniref:RCC1-like domain-containing protein n=2 Tax=Agaricus bisporus var. burnettii TaxID=192524 RepID=K5XAB8_AGABU|nr:uncharacterized protein AGABI1DRAFT_72781 [Agaricus bisporus var. burnettii JB137-S8]EKM80007.1 hypothetical protein AGABI1DRAFT_72781 [Agaricus bisporus var. burnettii JB137-S8]KAF7776656.1 hypothetical protein Agabi119p4_5049 [Agaricus bisporus var. burnettii]
MPPRRSSRPAAAKPPSAPVSKSAAKAPARSRSQPARKRAASPSRDERPAPKRLRTAPPSQKSENIPPPSSRKPRSKPSSAAKPQPTTRKRGRPKLGAITEAVESKETKPLEKKKVPKEPKQKPTPIPQSKPYLNPLPTPPPTSRPSPILFVFGAGNFGQFGMGPDVLDSLTKPKRNQWVEEQISKGTFGEVGAGITAVAGGGLHTLFADEKGTVWSCGANDNAALGRITTDVPDPDNEGSFLDVDDLTSWPRPLQTLVDEHFRAVLVAAGDSIGAVVSDQGELRVWGTFRGMEGALGFSDGKDKQHLPTPILTLSHKPGDYEKVSSVAAGNNHLVIVTTHGHLYTLGVGEQGQLGRKILERRKIHGTHPEKICLGTRSRKAVKVAAGSYHSFAIDDNDDVWGWGLNTMGQTGTGWSSRDDDCVHFPQKVESLSRESLSGDTVVQIAAGEHHTIFLTAAGKVYSCGRMDGSQLGLEDDNPAIIEWKEKYAEMFDGAVPQFLPTPTEVAFPDADDAVVQISTGVHNNAVVTRGGALLTWGQGIQGELGCGDDEEVETPKVVVRKDGGSWFAVAVSCGGQHTLGLLKKK